ncbi:uncharacterized protein YutE (UPF0331/DUF86 family) [Alkalibacillus flavidus]|uniref:Uncharacterized protein YutE (UPF0331/DUF86 family) n=1 Tax=Alkalibacillus flavidus TaxID=546021 RepID=A0ABV2KX26_9BACI
MYFVDQESIDETLTYYNRLLETYERTDFSTDDQLFGLERIVHMTIESIIDVGNMMIDGFIMRDPGSYDDIIDILIDEQVIPAETESTYKRVIGMRSTVIKDYTNINHDTLRTAMDDGIQTLKQFPSHIYRYLEREMGPITAFKKREGES